MKEKKYTAESIKVLKGLEAVRKRPAMYVGSTGPEGLHHLVYEVVDNSIDEALAGYCTQIDVFIHVDDSVTVIDNGRGIPVEMHKKEKKSAAEVVMTMLHAGGKFDDKTYKVSGGLHGVGVSVVNALSKRLDLEVKRDGGIYTQSYERGNPVTRLKLVGKTKKTGTKITFWPDDEIFDSTEFNFEVLTQRMRELSFLNRGLKITILDERTNKSHEFQYKGGILEFVQYLNQNKNVLNPRPIYFESQKDDIQVELAFQYNSGYAETIFTFVNNINTTEGGTHLIGFKAALTRCINNYAVAHNLFKDLSAGTHLRGRHPRGAVRRPQHQDEGSPVRGPDQDQAGKFRGQGYRRVAGQRAAHGLPRREPDKRQARRHESPGRGPCPGSRPQGQGTGPSEERPRVDARSPASSPTARSGTRPRQRSSSSRAIRPAAQPNRAAIAGSRPSSLSKARSSTSRRRPRRRSSRTRRSG